MLSPHNIFEVVHPHAGNDDGRNLQDPAHTVLAGEPLQRNRQCSGSYSINARRRILEMSSRSSHECQLSQQRHASTGSLAGIAVKAAHVARHR